ncbi:MAG: sigma-70 family RNA polymerase sigma factor, partial [Kordiimonadaceae bacterium]|nr:sigma-70 family RNA polymerase sigma factor [Kordiimonadaceae bacterium]
YLFRIARNLIVDYIRSVNSKYAPKELVEFGQIADLAEEGLGLEDMFAIRSRINKTCEVVSALSASCQRIFWLSRLYGYKNSEIAEQEGVCLSTVEKNISRALKHCRTEAVLQAA